MRTLLLGLNAGIFAVHAIGVYFATQYEPRAPLGTILPTAISALLGNLIAINIGLISRLRAPSTQWATTFVQDGWRLQVTVHVTNRTPRHLEISNPSTPFMLSAFANEAAAVTVGPGDAMDIDIELTPADVPPTGRIAALLTRSPWIELALTYRFRGRANARVKRLLVDNPFASTPGEHA